MSNLFVLWKHNPGRDRVRENAHAFIDRLPDNHSFAIEIKRHTKKRSDDQNRYLWVVVYATLRRETGNEPEHLHEYFLGEFFGWETVDVLGQQKRVPMRRSSKLSTMEFAEFVAFIQQRSAETAGVYIPDPDPFHEDARAAACFNEAPA
jgi:hypothetical protein